MEFIFELLTYFTMFHTQLFFAELLICAHIKRRKYFGLMMFLGLVYTLVPYILYDFYFWQGFMYKDWFTIGFLILLAISVMIIALAFEVKSKKELFFYSSAAFLVQHLMYTSSETVNMLLKVQNENMQIVIAFVVNVIMYVLFFFVLVAKIKRGDVLGIRNRYLMVFILFSMFIVYILSLWINSVEGATLGKNILDIFCIVLLLIIQFGMFEKNRLEKENEIMNKILSLGEQKNSNYIENIELINIKCHDLKYQIQMLRENENIEDIDESLKEIEEAVMIYDMSVKTGNDTLDVIIAERSLQFNKYNIRFSCIADGDKLDFISPVDLYALFGNALDNAIESVKLIENEEQRIINLNISSKGNNVIVHLKNNYCHEVIFVDGMPKTSKEDKDYHGYGIRSMKYLIEKYDGTFSVSAKEQVFIVNMLFQTS